MKETNENAKTPKAGKIILIAVIVLLCLALIACMAVIFLHRHTMTHFEAEAATCTDAGNTEYWYCAGCDAYFADAQGSEPISAQSVEIAATGHSWTGASCTSPRHCSVCSVADGEALGHLFETYVPDGNAACTADGTETAVCVRCDETHTRVDADTATGHTYLETVVEKQPTCAATGILSHICETCGHVEKGIIPATGVHNWESARIEMPEDCSDHLVAQYSCADCDKVYEVTVTVSGEHTWLTDEGTILEGATCTEEGALQIGCATCAETLILPVPANGAHVWEQEQVTKPGCSAAGKAEYSCKYCDETMETVIPAIGSHLWDLENGAVTPATDTLPGKIVYSCLDCSETFEVTLPATGAHEYGEPQVTLPTCTATGSVTFPCVECGDLLTATLPASGHHWMDATCIAPQTCAVCGATQGAAAGHSWGAWVAYGGIHLRECSVCSAADWAEHTYEEGTCTVCGAEEPVPETGSGYTVNGITVTVENGDNGTLLDPENNILYPQLVGLWVASGYSYATTVTVRGVATEDSDISFTLSGVVSDRLTDLYVALKNEAGDVRIEYHPMRFHLSVYRDGQMVPVKFCDGCENCSGHTHEDDPSAALTCPQCDNCYLRTMSELQEYLASEDNLLNLRVRAGEAVDLTFEIGWLWSFAIDPPKQFEIRGEDGTRYYFDNNGNSGSYKGYVDGMDTVLGQNPQDTVRDVYDMDGNRWYMQADDLQYSSAICYMGIRISSVSDEEP